MSQQQNTEQQRSITIHMAARLREGIFIVTIAVTVFLFAAFFTFHISDPAWTTTGAGTGVLNAGGKVGALVADICLFLIGYVAYLLPILLCVAAWLGFQHRFIYRFQSWHFFFRIIGFTFILLSLSGLTDIVIPQALMHLPARPGGAIGNIVSGYLISELNPVGTLVILVASLLMGFTLFTGISWLALLNFMRIGILALIKSSFRRAEPTPSADKPVIKIAKPKIVPKPVVEKLIQSKTSSVKINEPAPALSAVKPVQRATRSRGSFPPPVSLLNPPDHSKVMRMSTAELEETSRLVETRLLDFSIEVKVVSVHPGPVVTRYELELAPGIKVSKLTTLSKDLARSLSTISVRVVEVIPGKPFVGLELPNKHREMVNLREVLETEQYDQARSPVSMVLGKDIAGYPVVVDLAKMPHLLVAGTTGSGKSVGVNAMLASILLKSTPEEVRLILIDPKMLELAVYEGIPHLLTPVITDMKEAANALRWAVAEMDKRYRLMAFLGVRNLAGYNTKLKKAKKEGEALKGPAWLAQAEGEEPPELEPLPTIVVIIDEFADMMMVVGKKVENLIARIAQKARAAGIHMILATQRPSVDVITGIIKANIPTRIAFQVSSRIDSRTILDQQGAEQLLGHGDMLYLAPGTGLPMRVHGAYVGDDEVHALVKAWKKYGEPTYLEHITTSADGEGDGEGDGRGSGEQDPLYDEAVKIVTETRRASISALQRRLRIGYNRSARIVDEMEAAGVVGPMEGGSREVYAPPPVED